MFHQPSRVIVRMAALLALIMPAALQRARADSPTSPAADDPKMAEQRARLKGDWQALRGEMDGAPREESFVLRFEDTRIIKIGKTKREGSTYQLEPSPGPVGHMIIYKDGSKKPLFGIYQIEQDKMKLCFGPTRPAEFRTVPGQKALLLFFERKSEAPPPSGK